MAKAGRRPIPTPVLQLRGSWRGKVPPPDGEVAPVALPPAPTWLAPTAKKYWAHYGALLEEVGHMTPLTVGLLLRYCVALVRWEVATQVLQAEGDLCQTDKGYVYTHPSVKVVKELGQELLRLEQELGMTPGSARSLGTGGGRPGKEEGGDDAHGKHRFFKK